MDDSQRLFESDTVKLALMTSQGTEIIDATLPIVSADEYAQSGDVTIWEGITVRFRFNPETLEVEAF